MSESLVTVFTPTITGREHFLVECRASVAAQTLSPLEHLVELDEFRSGPGFISNRVVSKASGKWLVPLGDDDLLDPDFLSMLWPHTANADVVYCWCRVDGSPWCPNRLYRKGTLRDGNYIPATALIRKSLWEKLGGYNVKHKYEDWDFWLRAENEGARFVCVPEVLWTYRQHGGNLFNKIVV